MRYIIDTEDSEGIIGIQIDKWKKENKLSIIEKGQPLVEIKEHLERVARALETLKKAGYNSEVMVEWIHGKTDIARGTVREILEKQDEFFKKIGVKVN